MIPCRKAFLTLFPLVSLTLKLSSSLFQFGKISFVLFLLLKKQSKFPILQIVVTCSCLRISSCSDCFSLLRFSLTLVSKTVSISFSIFFIFKRCSLERYLIFDRKKSLPFLLVHLFDWAFGRWILGHDAGELLCSEVFVVHARCDIDQILKSG